MTVRDTDIVCETVCHGVSARDSAFHAQSHILQDPLLNFIGEPGNDDKNVQNVASPLLLAIGITV